MNRKKYFIENCNQIIPIAIIGGTFSFFVISTVNYHSVYWYPWLVSSRIMLGIVAALLIAWLTLKPVKWLWIDSIYITLGLAVQASHGILEPVKSVDFYQYTALFFIAAALSYKGSFRTWLTTFLPVQAACILFPLCVKEYSLHNSLPVIIDIYSMPIAGLLIGSAMARLSATKHEALVRNLNLQQKLLEEYHGQQEKYEALGNMANQVAHDIRSPLSSLKAAAKMLQGHVAGNVEAMEVVNLLQLSGNRLENIANDLLARHQGVTSAGPVVFSIHEVLDELIGEFQTTPLGENTIFQKHYSSGALYVSGDKTGMARAIGNIIKNALEAMRENSSNRSRQLTVSTSAVPHCDNIMIRITDTGAGIPKDKIPLILRGGHTSGKVDGHGIGTKVVLEMVEAHNGTLNIESDVGVGTTFAITLPQKPSIKGCEAEVIVNIPYSGEGAIRVIDDEPSMREQWRLTLKGLGVDVESFMCWEDYAVGHSPHSTTTFIIDYHFDNSEIDGIEIIRRLKELGFSNLVLATAEYWKPTIKEVVQKLDVTLCPKPLPKVALALCHPDAKPKNLNGELTEKPDKISILVIDDDPVIRQTWKLQCKVWNIPNIYSFESMEECVQSDVDLNRVDLAFVDKNIEGSAWATDTLIAHLKSGGVRKVWISSGEAFQDLENDLTCEAADGIVEGKIPLEIEPYVKEISSLDCLKPIPFS